jgi:hypothetical protein
MMVYNCTRPKVVADGKYAVHLYDSRGEFVASTVPANRRSEASRRAFGLERLLLLSANVEGLRGYVPSP